MMGKIFSSRFRKGFLSCLFILILFLSQICCSPKTQSPHESAAEIRIGFIITTAEDRIKTNSWNLVELFQNRFKKEQGLKVAGKRHPVTFVIREIEGGNIEQTVRAVNELINQENVVAIIGPNFSIDAIPAGEVAEVAGIPLVSPTSTHPLTTARRKCVFRTAFVDTFQAQTMARFCVHELGAENIAVLYNVAYLYSRGLADVFKETVIQEGGQVQAFEDYVTGDTVFTDQLEKIKDIGPDILYLPNFPEETESIAIQARDLGIGAVLLGVDSWDGPKFSRMDQFNGSYLTAHMSPDALTGEPKAFFDEYLSRYGLELEDGAALTYDGIGIVFAAIQFAKSYEPDAIRDALYDMGPYEGVAGKIDFIDSGDPEREAVIVRFEKGRTRFIKKILTGHEDQPKSQGEM